VVNPVLTGILVLGRQSGVNSLLVDTWPQFPRHLQTTDVSLEVFVHKLNASIRKRLVIFCLVDPKLRSTLGWVDEKVAEGQVKKSDGGNYFRGYAQDRVERVGLAVYVYGFNIEKSCE
jgi:hypothetical protein